jgi:hypothetical protein
MIEVSFMDISGFYALAANAIVAFHFTYVMFVVIGELTIILGWIFNWKWIRNMPFRIIHFIATLTVAIQALVKVPCPLTVWEADLRELAGQTAERDITFVARLIRSLIFFDFPDWFFLMLYVGFGAIVLITLILVPPKIKRK